ncbi:transposable element Tcb1 transposase [Trichonephila clavipes]|nr:transposable element Tcb1 transposase [Trichonephila clavipes]
MNVRKIDNYSGEDLMVWEGIMLNSSCLRMRLCDCKNRSPVAEWLVQLAFTPQVPRFKPGAGQERSAFDQVSEFDRGRIVVYRDCGLPFWEIGSRVGRNQTTIMRICDSWMQEGTMDRRGRSHPPQCTTSREDRQIVRMAVTARSVTSRTVAQHIESVTHHSVSARTIRRRLQQSVLSTRRPLLGLPLTQNHGRLNRQ